MYEQFRKRKRLQRLRRRIQTELKYTKLVPYTDDTHLINKWGAKHVVYEPEATLLKEANNNTRKVDPSLLISPDKKVRMLAKLIKDRQVLERV